MSNPQAPKERRSSQTSTTSFHETSVTVIERRPLLLRSPDPPFIRQPAIMPVYYRTSPTETSSALPPSNSPLESPTIPILTEIPALKALSALSSTGSVPPSPTSQLSVQNWSSEDEDTVNLDPAFTPVLHSANNGTQLTELKHHITHPSQTAKRIRGAAVQQASSIDKDKLKKRAGELYSDASEVIAERLNRAFSGFDAVRAVEAFDKAQARLPSFGIPNNYKIRRVVDSVTDGVQKLLPKPEKPVSLSPDAGGGSQMEVVWIMSGKACTALVKQGICPMQDLVLSRANLEWHTGLKDHLADYYVSIKEQYAAAELMSMTPVWIPQREKNVWGLYLKVKKGKLSEKLDTKFSFPPPEGWTKRHNHTMGSVATFEDEDWVVVEK